MKEDRQKELADRYVFVLVQLNRLMYSGRMGELKKLNLNVLQVHTLIMLKYHGGQRMSAISKYLGCTLSRVTNLADALQRKNYMKRSSDPNDRRVVICELTDQGKEAAERFLGLVKERTRKVVDLWEQEQFESVVETLELLWRTEDQVYGSISTDQSLD